MIWLHEFRYRVLTARQGRHRASQARSRCSRRRPVLEPLEGRALLNSGGLDPSFGGTGVVITNLGPADEKATSVVVQPWDDEVVVASRDEQPGQAGSYEFALVRYNPDGTLDSTFGSGGIVAIHVSSGNDSINQIILTPDQKILAVGWSHVGTGQEIALARFNSNGTLDNTFGSGGVVLTHVSGKTNDAGDSVILDPSGRIIVGGSSYQGTSGRYTFANVLLRLNANGTLDKTFGSQGKVVGTYGSHTYDAWGTLEILPSGSTYQIAALGVDNGNNVVAHFNANGSRVSGFGSNGEVVLVNGGGSAFQSDGKIVGAYETGSVANDAIVVLRYNADGTPDSTFGTAGEVVTYASSFFGGSQALATADAVAIDPQGRIVVSGRAGIYDDWEDSMLLRFNANGTIDATFGQNGVELVMNSPIGDRSEYTALTFQPDGNIIAAGYVYTSYDNTTSNATTALDVARHLS
jgi:uncharacterized delta-60 repeat protein